MSHPIFEGLKQTYGGLKTTAKEIVSSINTEEKVQEPVKKTNRAIAFGKALIILGSRRIDEIIAKAEN